MGSETEFGLWNGWSFERAVAIQHRVETLPHLASAKGSGVFLGNGARCYVDNGRHNEYATPECEDPADLVAHELAGRRLLQRCAEQGGTDGALLCSNVDPLSGATWGTHENYECPKPLLPAESAILETHLVTRLLYTGAGGIDTDDPGIRLVLSPRARTLRRRAASQGVYARAMIYGKGEDHGAGFRLHLMAGESLLSHTASYLKYASTRLVTLLITSGVRVGPAPFGPRALHALRRVNRDLSLSAVLELSDGRRMTALDIQEALWTDVAHHVHQLPSWAPTALARWRDILDALRADNPSVARRVDWMIFRDAAMQLCAARGFPFESIPDWNARVRARTPRLPPAASPGDLRRRRLHQGPSSEFQRFLETRFALAELYIRLHALGRESLFETLAGGEHGTHRLPEITEARIEEAIVRPPSGRAANRAAWIRHHPHERSLRISWEMVVDLPREHRMELPDEPLSTAEDPWILGPAVDPASAPGSDSLFLRGRYAEFLRGMPERPGASVATWDIWFLETVCLAFARLGRPSECEAYLDVYRLKAPPIAHASIRLGCHTNHGLAPDPAALLPLVTAVETLEAGGLGDPYFHFVFRMYRARMNMLRHADSDARAKAEQELRALIAEPGMQGRPRMQSRCRCYLAELRRQAGALDEARVLVDTSLAAYRAAHLEGDLAHHALTQFAKQAADPAAVPALAEAIQILRQNRNPHRLGHALCLQARRLRRADHHDEIQELARTVPALQSCALAQRILANWESWTHPDTDWSSTDYWGL